VRIGEAACDFEGAGLRVNGAVDEDDAPLVGVELSVGKSELQGNGIAAVEQVGSASLRSLGKFEVFLLADAEVDLDGVDLGDSGEHRGGTDEVPDLNLSEAGDAVDEGADLGESEVKLCGFDGGFSAYERGLACGDLLDVVVELALGDGMGLGEGAVAVQVDFGELKLRLDLLQCALCPVEVGLKGARVNLEEDLAFVDDGAFAVILMDEIAGNFRRDLRVDVTCQGADPASIYGHILLFGRHNGERHGAEVLLLSFRWPGRTSGEQKWEQGSTEKAHGARWQESMLGFRHINIVQRNFTRLHAGATN
jgi:hypothetical protein